VNEKSLNNEGNTTYKREKKQKRERALRTIKVGQDSYKNHVKQKDVRVN
jgi:hypothetical protein